MTENEAMALMRCRIDTASEIVGKGTDCKAFEDMEMAISALKEIQQYREIGTVEECRKAVEKQKVFCDSAEKCADGKCVGYGKSEMDDEPIEMCKQCKSYICFEESEEG